LKYFFHLRDNSKIKRASASFATGILEKNLFGFAEYAVEPQPLAR